MDPDIAPGSPDGWSRSGARVSCGSQAEAAATLSGRRSGSCHHDIQHPWPLVRRQDSICGSAASRCKIRHKRPRPQVALGINLCWQERGNWLARVGVLSIASRYALWIRGIPLLGNGSVALTCVCRHHGPTCTPQDLGTLRVKMEPQSVCQFAL